MKRSDALPYVSYVVDDAGSGRPLGEDVHAIARERQAEKQIGLVQDAFEYASVLIGWQCGFEPMFVAVHSYLDVRLDDDEAESMAREYLDEIGIFWSISHTDADYIIR